MKKKYAFYMYFLSVCVPKTTKIFYKKKKKNEQKNKSQKLKIELNDDDNI